MFLYARLELYCIQWRAQAFDPSPQAKIKEFKLHESKKWGLSAVFQLDLWIPANSVRNVNTAKSLQKSRRQFASRRKRSPTLDPGSCLGYTSILIHLSYLKMKIIISPNTILLYGNERQDLYELKTTVLL